MTVSLLASYSGLLGGAERALLQFAAGLDGERWLACPEGALADAGRAAGLRITPVTERRLELRGSRRDRGAAALRLLAHGHELRSRCESLDPDLVVVCGMRSMLGLAAALGGPGGARLTGRAPNRAGRLCGARLTDRAPDRVDAGRAPVVFLHNDFLPGPVIAAAVRRAARRADLVVVPSRAVADDLGLAATVAAPGVAPAFFAVEPAPADPPSVLVLGALVGWKRLDLALEAVALARRTHPPLRLRIAGGRLSDESDAVLAAIEARAAAPDLAGHVELLGEVGDPAAELARCACLLHCADREPYGIAVAEALAAARPAVVPSGSGPAEIVDAACGLTFTPGDATGAAAAIRSVLDDPDRAAALGVRGRARAAEHFTGDGAEQRFAAAVAPLVESPRPGVAATARVGPARPGVGVAPHVGPARPGAAVTARGGEEWTIVTVTHNSGAALEGLLTSVVAHAPAARVIVVDNASDDATLEVAEGWRERCQVEILSLTENVGFGAACNRGVALCQTPVTALLNPDVELLDGSLERLVAAAAAAPAGAAALLGPLVLSADASRQHTAHPLPGSAGDRLHALVPGALPAGLAAASVAPWRATRERPAGWLVGCALVARTETFARLGPFDPGIFLYGEDLDLGLRAHAAGVAVRFCPQARVLHHGAHASDAHFGGEPFTLLARTRHDAVAANLGPRAAARDDLTQALTFASRAALKAVAGRPPTRERAQLAALRTVRR